MSNVIELRARAQAASSTPPMDSDSVLDRLVHDMVRLRNGGDDELKLMLDWSARIWAKYRHQLEGVLTAPPGLPRPEVQQLLSQAERHYSQLMLRLLVEMMHSEYEGMLLRRSGAS